jgi:hypothetical protein
MYRDHFHFVANEIELDDVVDFVCRIRGQAFDVDVTRAVGDHKNGSFGEPTDEGIDKLIRKKLAKAHRVAGDRWVPTLFIWMQTPAAYQSVLDACQRQGAGTKTVFLVALTDLAELFESGNQGFHRKYRATGG